MKIGGPNKTVQIDESKFGRRKYHRGHPVKEQCVFGGVERESGKTFLVPNRTADTFMAVIDAWINPALRSSVIAGERSGISTRKVTHTAPLTTALTSLTSIQAPTQTV